MGKFAATAYVAGSPVKWFLISKRIFEFVYFGFWQLVLPMVPSDLAHRLFPWTKSNIGRSHPLVDEH